MLGFSAMRRLMRRPTAVLLSSLTFLGAVALGAATVLGQPLVALAAIGVGILGLQAATLLAQRRSAARALANMRRIETRVLAVEKLVARSEWRSGEASNEVLEELRRVGRQQARGQGGVAQDLWQRGGPLRGRPSALEQDLERYLVQLLRRWDGDR